MQCINRSNWWTKFGPMWSRMYCPVHRLVVDHWHSTKSFFKTPDHFSIFLFFIQADLGIHSASTFRKAIAWIKAWLTLITRLPASKRNLNGGIFLPDPGETYLPQYYRHFGNYVSFCFKELRFPLPAGSGKRISLAVIIRLALAVFMTLVGYNLPNSSEPFPKPGYYFLVLVFLAVPQPCASSPKFNSVVYYKDEETRPLKCVMCFTKAVMCFPCRLSSTLKKNHKPN